MILNYVRFRLGVELAEANRYFENFRYSTETRDWGRGPDTIDYEFEATRVLRILLDFKGSGRLTPAAESNLTSLITGFEQPRPVTNRNNDRVARWPVIHTENHDLMLLTIGYFREILFGRNAAAHALQLRRWLAWRLERGFVEWNSPVYAVHTLNPLLTLCRHAPHRLVRLGARDVINLMLAERALLGVRGYLAGPYNRGIIEHFQDSRTSRFQEVAWTAFGYGPPLDWFGDCCFAGDTFEPHPVVCALAREIAERPPARLWYRGTRGSVNNLRQASNLGGERLPICYYTTPHVSMGSINMKGWWKTGRGFDVQFAADPAHSLRTFRGSVIPYARAGTAFPQCWVEAAQYRGWALSRGEVQHGESLRPQRADEWNIYRSGKGLCAVRPVFEDWHVFQVDDLDRFASVRQFVNALAPPSAGDGRVVARTLDGETVVVYLHDLRYTVNGEWADWSDWLHDHELLRAPLDCGKVEIRSSRDRLVLDAAVFKPPCSGAHA